MTHHASTIRMQPRAAALLRCPACKGALQPNQAGTGYACPSCSVSYPVVDGIPILVNEARSIFSISDYVSRQDTFWKDSRLRQQVLSVLPSLDANVTSKNNYARFRELLLADTPSPVVLIIGGSREGAGIHDLLHDPAVCFVEADISFGPRTSLIADGHDLPFEDGSLDAVIIQAVLEHVVDPERCVSEIHRVLKPGGLVYAETPLMQQVHAGPYDFARFTHLGHRRLFRRFDEIDSGLACGPGMALAHAVEYFWLSFFKRKSLRYAVKLVCRLLLFWVKYADYLLVRFPGALDAASGYYFMGRAAEHVLSDRDLIKLYRGAN